MLMSRESYSANTSSLSSFSTFVRTFIDIIHYP